MSYLAEAAAQTSKLSQKSSVGARSRNNYSLFFEILSHHSPLSTGNRETLASLQEPPRRFEKGSVIKNSDLNTKHLLAIQDGWACSCRVTGDGKRQIIDLYLPGDIVGLREYHAGGRFDEVVMLTEGLVIPMCKSQLDQLIQQDHNLVNAVLAASTHQCNIMADRLTNLLSHDATTRIAYFILELHARLSFSRAGMRELTLPVSQQVIGDLLGMTNVHVCRCLCQLESQGLLIRDKESRNIRLIDHAALLALAGFSTSYLYCCSRVRKLAATG